LKNFVAHKVEMIKYTQPYLKKLEDLLKDNLYEVRYEKGNFKSGYCILEHKKVVVVNKFSTLESRIQSLFEILQLLTVQGRIVKDDQELFLKDGEPAHSYVASEQDESA
jgi:hypothetical protein